MEWQQNRSGPQHQETWNVTLYVKEGGNMFEYGRGEGPTQAIAREIACEQGMFKLEREIQAMHGRA